MRVLVTGTEGYIGSPARPVPRRARPRGGRSRRRLLPRRLRCTTARRSRWRRWPRTSASSTAADFDGIRRGRAHGRALERPARPARARRSRTTINHRGSLHLAATAKAAGIERFVYTSSCSVYGAADAGPRRRGVAARARRPRTPSASGSSSGTSARWPTTTSRRPSCATRPPTAPRRGCGSTSS